jgi:DNA-binding transcriptional ArsR family regulator
MNDSLKPRTMTTRKPASEPADFRHLAGRFKQVSDLTRLSVLLLLGDGERSVGDLSAATGCSSSMSALSRHLALLRLAGIIVPRREGQLSIYTLTDTGRGLRRVIAGVVG